MSNSLLNLVLEDFEKSIKNIEEVLNMKRTDIIRDSSIKRFELCFDLAWKSVKTFAKIKEVECYTPAQCFKTAFQLKIINQDEDWIKMVKDRNESVHIYKEKQADKIYSKLPNYSKLFKELLNKLKEENQKL